MIRTGYNPTPPPEISQTGKRPEKIPTLRPKGRTPGALHCNNSHIDFKQVRQSIRQFTGPKAFLGPTMEKVINNAHRLVHSQHLRAMHRSLGYNHRTRFGYERDIAALQVLFGTVSMVPCFNGEYFRCYVNNKWLSKLALFDSKSRASRFLNLLKITDLVKLIYKQSIKNKEMKHCEIYLSRKAFLMAGATNDEIDEEIERKARNVQSRLTTPGTPEHEEANAMKKKIARYQYEKNKTNQKRIKAQKKLDRIEDNKKSSKVEIKRQAIQQLAQLQKEYPNRTLKQLKLKIIRYYPEYAKALGLNDPP